MSRCFLYSSAFLLIGRSLRFSSGLCLESASANLLSTVRVGFHRVALQHRYPKYLEIESKYWSDIMCFCCILDLNEHPERKSFKLDKKEKRKSMNRMFSNLNLLISDRNQFFPKTKSILSKIFNWLREILSVYLLSKEILTEETTGNAISYRK